MLEAISDLMEGKLAHPVIDALYCKIELLQRDLENDNEAMNWFNLSGLTSFDPQTPQVCLAPSFAGQFFFQFLIVCLMTFPHDRRTHFSTTIVFQLASSPYCFSLCINFVSFFTFSTVVFQPSWQPYYISLCQGTPNPISAPWPFSVNMSCLEALPSVTFL